MLSPVRRTRGVFYFLRVRFFHKIYTYFCPNFNNFRIWTLFFTISIDLSLLFGLKTEVIAFLTLGTLSRRNHNSNWGVKGIGLSMFVSSWHLLVTFMNENAVFMTWHIHEPHYFPLRRFSFKPHRVTNVFGGKIKEIPDLLQQLKKQSIRS